MASIFTKIINGEIPAYKIAENNDFIAFLDAFPIAKGHTLVVPKQEIDRIWDLPLEQFNGLMAFAYQVANAIEKTIDCNRVGISVMGLEVPHAHVHLVPMNDMGDMNFAHKIEISKKEMEEIRASVASNFEKI